MRFLLTGFAPFGGSRINPSYEAVRRLPETLGEHRIFRAELPVVYGQCGEVLAELIERVQPDCVLCFGQAAGREGISLESTAVNVKAASAPDNAGALLKDAGLPTKISYSAGTYVCNDLFYNMLRYAEENEPRLMCGFIHLPVDESQLSGFAPGTPFMPTSEVVRAMRLMIAYLGETVPGTF